MTHIITALCTRDSACVDVCPVECIVGGQPESEWPWFYIDPEVCIDCGACIPECPLAAIFLEEEVPDAYTVPEGVEYITHEEKVLQTSDGTVVLDLTKGIQPNYDFFESGPGYDAL